MILLPQKVAYRGTITGLRISSVDGTAFIDACADLVPYADGNHLVEIYSATGMLRGYLAAAGTGETTTEYVVDGAFTSSDNWTEGTAWAVAGGVATYDNSANANAMTQTGWTVPQFVLGKLTATVASAGSASLYILNAAGTYAYWTPNGAKTLTSDTYSYYKSLAHPDNGNRTGIAVFGYTAGAAFTLDNLSFASVDSPSADGCTIVSERGGAVQSFSYRSSFFDYNSATNYVVVRKAR